MTNAPSAVVDRFTKHANKDLILSRSAIRQFSSVDPNNASKTVMIDQLYYLDGGYRLIARNGAFFDLNSQGSDDEKQFLSNFPVCSNHAHFTIVCWYGLVVQVGAAYGFYIHPYECFRAEATNLPS